VRSPAFSLNYDLYIYTHIYINYSLFIFIIHYPTCLVSYFQFGLFLFFFCISCVPGWLIISFYSTEQTQNSFSLDSFFFLIEYVCMLLFDESVEQSLLSMISIFIYISFFCSSCRLLIFGKNPCLFLLPVCVFVYLERKRTAIFV
jgi:hypothetical protein